MNKNKPVYLSLSILEFSKMYELLYDYVKQIYGKKGKLYCMHVICIQTVSLPT